jgi:hypothetical protein
VHERIIEGISEEREREKLVERQTDREREKKL